MGVFSFIQNEIDANMANLITDAQDAFDVSSPAHASQQRLEQTKRKLAEQRKIPSVHAAFMGQMIDGYRQTQQQVMRQHPGRYLNPEVNANARGVSHGYDGPEF